MKTYNDLLHEHKEAFIQNDIPLETIKAFLFELCSERDIDLYLKKDEKVPLELLEAFEKGVFFIIGMILLISARFSDLNTESSPVMYAIND